jgi:hypothetical protein
MTDKHTPPKVETEDQLFPIEPRYHPIHRIPRLIYDFLASARLAMVLLVVILVSCVTGATVYRGVKAAEMIFSTLWFNGLLLLLVVNVACCFFGRVWHRKITVISFGMILFHLSFVAVFLGIIYNSLFYFRGDIRLTEGETLQSTDPQSYDSFEKGRFFAFSRLYGETTLVRMHAGYKVSGEDKRAAYEVAVGEGAQKKQGIIYITHKLTYRGVDYFNESEGYSLLLTMADVAGMNPPYGVIIPLQSIRQGDESFVYTTGYSVEKGKVNADSIPFPQPPEKPLVALQVIYKPDKKQARAGEVTFKLTSLDDKGLPRTGAPFAEGTVPIGKPFPAGEHSYSAREVRYWVRMMVRYEPGKPIVLASLCIGLAGMVITMLGRIMRKKVLSS